MAAPIQLRCEYFVAPIGIDARRPRFSWILDDDRRGAGQTAYQITVSSSDQQLWDSGKVESDQSIHVEFAGPLLKSRQRCEWKVRVWDQDGKQTDWSEPSQFEMGLLDRADWRAKR